MEWKSSFSVGVWELDVQHRGLLELINEIGQMADAGSPSKSEAFGSLNAMICYAENHFSTEEEYLSRYNYPRLEQQQKEHAAFVETAFSLADDLEKQGALSLGTIIMYLQDWYTDHVLGADQEYKEFLADKLNAGQ